MNIIRGDAELNDILPPLLRAKIPNTVKRSTSGGRTHGMNDSWKTWYTKFHRPRFWRLRCSRLPLRVAYWKQTVDRTYFGVKCKHQAT